MNALPAQLLDWGQLSPLRLRARELADGLYTGSHRSRRRGSGIEFDGHRDYVQGDDLRRLDYRALMRHGRLLIRQFETETERSLSLLVDATRSMAFRSERGPAAKLAYASLLAAALGRVAVSTGDLVSLDWLGGSEKLPLRPGGGREAFERLVVALEHVQPGGDEHLNDAEVQRALAPIARRAKRGSVIVLFSDLIDLPPGTARHFAALSSRDRSILAVQVLDPVEAQFPFDGALRLRPSFGGEVVETDARSAKDGYLRALARLKESWHTALIQSGGHLLECQTDEDPKDVIRRILATIERRPL